MRRRWLALLGVLIVVPLAAVAARLVWRRANPPLPLAVRWPSETLVAAAELSILRMELDDAERLLEHASGVAASRARARLAIYRADCEGATVLLGASATSNDQASSELAAFAARCAGATVGGRVLEDRERGIWIRFQDRNDEVLFPLLVDGIARARASIEKDLGTPAPRPLRLDLVRDAFSLSAVSDLPLESAETTGTVAVARWGRVTMLSPRATGRGYPWQDTLAHEITHLVLSRATAERAPLWLQEGVAKRQETRWRDARLLDGHPDPSRVAFQAQRSGRSVGVDKLGPSIAMLPSADAAGIAFAEVTSFVGYWLERNGEEALPALLRELGGGARDAEAALRGVSGLGLADWQVLWRADLERRFAEAGQSQEPDQLKPQANGRRRAIVERLVELLFVEGWPAEARERGAPELETAPGAVYLGFLVARAALAAGEGDWPLLLPPVGEIEGAHGGFLALTGLAARTPPTSIPVEVGDPASVSHVPGAWGGAVGLGTAEGAKEASDPNALFAHALSLDPLLPEVACEGQPHHAKSPPDPASGPLPSDPSRRALCLHTRTLPVRGGE
ncbi:MAG TPA: hypothetical protein VLC09_17160 [Polyangiaceae bacterium]|nr:hypothetical protein [Polyangiaceae bacterium]